jgi:hypothetical protein
MSIVHFKIHKLVGYILFFMILINPTNIIAQPGLPLRAATVTATQSLSFGDLTLLSGSAGGTATVDYTGSRSKTGSVLLLNLGTPVQPAIFELKLCPGRVVVITYPPTITLSAGGHSMTLHIGPTSVGSSGDSFITNKGCDDTHLISVGGTLDIGSISANPSGLYTGSFDLTFVQQ